MLKEFEKFVHSHYFNKNETLIHSFLLLRISGIFRAGIDRERLFFKLYKSREFDESRLRYALSDLSKLLETYIMLKELEKNKIHQKHLLLEFYRNHDIEKYFNQVFDETVKYLDSQKVKDAEFYFNRYLIEESLYNYSSANRDKSLDETLQDVADNLDYYYISKKLKYQCEMFTRQNFLNSSYNTALLDDLLKYIKTLNVDLHPAIHVYYIVLLTLIEEEKEENYQTLLKLLEKYNASFGKDELRDLYFFAQNYCTKRINNGDIRYLREYFKLSEKLLAKDLIYENGYIIPSTFKNIVTVGLRLEELEWVENFLYSYKEKLGPKYRENAFIYNLAWLHFFKGEYKKTLRLLSNVEYMDVYYILDSKILLLKTYYELDEIDAFYSLSDSFYVYLRRNELISDYQKTICLNFVKYAKKLMRIELGDKAAADKLLHELNENKQVASISWLIKKTKGFIKN